MKLKKQVAHTGEPEPEPEAVASDFEDAEAIELLFRGEWILDPNQSSPPFSLLDALTPCLEALELLGPSVGEASVLDKVSTGVFPNGVRHALVAGMPICWFEYGWQLKRAVETMFSNCTKSEQNLFDQARSALKHYVQYRSDRIILKTPVSKREENERCLISGRSQNVLHGTKDYFKLSREWFEYRHHIKELDADLSAVIKNALVDGRIICCRDSGGRAHLLHPSQTVQLKSSALTKKEYSYFLSRDLPEEWHSSPRPLPGKRKDARNWMKRVFIHFHHLGKRTTAVQLQQLAVKKFDLSADAVKNEWSRVSKEVRDELGIRKLSNVSTEIKVSDSEIKSLEL